MIIRDKKWLLHLRDEPCIFSSQLGNDNQSVVAHHIGGGGMGMKASDDLSLPMLQKHHTQVHQHGEASTYRKLLSDRVLIAMARAYAREQYAEWKNEMSVNSTEEKDNEP